MNDWVSVKDNVPNDYSDVLVQYFDDFSKDKIPLIGMAYYVKDLCQWFMWSCYDGAGEFQGIVTHWMNLPEITN